MKKDKICLIDSNNFNHKDFKDRACRSYLFKVNELHLNKHKFKSMILSIYEATHPRITRKL